MNRQISEGVRDPAVEDVTNLWLIHPLSRAGLDWAVRKSISANMVSIAGLCFGAMAAVAYLNWSRPEMALLGLVLSIAWLVSDGLDGMVARATGTSSAAGRLLDGLCDHGVFVCIYLALAWASGFSETIGLALLAGVLHAAQSSLYEAERVRYHRRILGNGNSRAAPRLSQNAGVRLYEFIFHAMDRVAEPFDRRLRHSADAPALANRYRKAARLPMKWMALLSANTRVFAIFLACLAGDPRLFWWFEIIALTFVATATILAHRRVEARLLA